MLRGISLLLGAVAAFAQPCATCHQKIAQSFRSTGMARSFYRPAPANTVEDYTNKNSYYHAPSDMHFTMVRRDNRYFQRQSQIGFDGRETNVVEKEIDFVLGSGNHARTYLHRTAAGTLQQLPLGWYAENGGALGGTWAMNPGYDRPDHQGFRRNVTYDCMFCHNAYPEIPAGNEVPRSTPVYSRVPEGIDCQRCHGNGDKHAALAAGTPASGEEIRAAIVNPSRLAPERQMEVCLQCHLETTSSPLPASIVRYERAPFSYRPGEPLGDFMLHFDRAKLDDRFEITGSAYRLRQSKCFLQSKGALKCTTCHDPHAAPRGEAAARHYTEACQQCHGTNLGTTHPVSIDCIGCHMPKRRTSDVVHVVMTDHYIQRVPPGNLLAPIAEKRQTDANAYRGEVTPYLPAKADELYLAIAQVSQGSNLLAGIAQVAAALQKYRPAHAEYYLQLGDALNIAGKPDAALSAYEEAVRREPESAAAQERLALCLSALRQNTRAEEILQGLLKLQPGTARLWVELGGVQVGAGKTQQALAAFEKAAQVDPEMPEAWNSAGAISLETGNAVRAETALRNAIRAQPNFAPAHNNLGNLLSAAGRFDEAAYHFEAAIRYQDNYMGARYNYALALARVLRYEQAQAQIEEVLRLAPQSAEAHEFLGNILIARGQTAQAIAQYRDALRIEPHFDRANLDVGTTLVKSGEVEAALPYLRAAAQSADGSIRQEARDKLQKLGH
jgi:predicted CXXCH cytochrome family protein